MEPPLPASMTCISLPLIEELEKLQVQLFFLHNPFGDTPQGKLLTQMQGMIAEYERTQILERTRRGRL